MQLPHSVTVYNIVIDTDPITLEDTVTNHITILRGVLLDATKGSNVNQSGLAGADAVTLHIPMDVVAVDGVTGEQKRYAGPMEFWAATDKSKLWTLSTDQKTFFVKGEAVEPNATEEYINLAHDGVYTVTKVDEKDFGGLQHWEVGGA